MSTQEERLEFVSKSDRTGRGRKAYVDWTKKNGVKLPFRDFLLDKCEYYSDHKTQIPNSECYIMWKCNDDKGPFVIKKYICGEDW